jgi:uncharacterized protein YcbK (DUF882 family)
MGRREIIKALAGGFVLGTGLPTIAAPISFEDKRTLNLVNLHTGERFSDVYFEYGEPVPEALRALNTVLRDHRTNDTHPIEPELFNWMQSLQQRLGGREFGIISGYRSPKTNEQLRANSNGVAKKSWHMQGRAIDLRLSGVDTAEVRKLAINDGYGGVGYYPESDFVHIDTGRPRSW